MLLLIPYNGFVRSIFGSLTEPAQYPAQRIDRIRSTLSSDLDYVWASTLSVFTEGKATEIEKSKLIADMTDCLRTYDALELWRDAEEVIRKEVVRGFVKKV